MTIFASKGPATVAVPNVVGLPESQARDRLAAAGLEVRVFEVFSDEPEGSSSHRTPARANVCRRIPACASTSPRAPAWLTSRR